MNAFQSLLDTVQPLGEDNEFRAELDESWLQGRTAFGGLTAALVVQAMLKSVDAERRLRSLYVSFVGPVPARQHRIRLRKLREGGNGYFHNVATVWAPDGTAVMFGRQVATVFEK